MRKGTLRQEQAEKALVSLHVSACLIRIIPVLQSIDHKESVLSCRDSDQAVQPDQSLCCSHMP